MSTRSLRFLTLATSALVACSGGNNNGSNSSGSPPVNTGFYLPYVAASETGGDNGLFVIPSNNLTAAPMFVIRGGVVPYAESYRYTLDNASNIIDHTPYALIYAYRGSDKYLRLYRIDLSDTSVSPTPVQISNLALGLGESICDLNVAQTNALDPTSLFIVLRTNSGTAPAPGVLPPACFHSADVFQLVRYTDSATTSPTLLQIPTMFQDVYYKPGGQLSGLVIDDYTNVWLYANETFTSRKLLFPDSEYRYEPYPARGPLAGDLRGDIRYVTNAAGGSIYSVPINLARISYDGSISQALIGMGSGITPPMTRDANNIYFVLAAPTQQSVYQVPISGVAPRLLYSATGVAFEPVGSNGSVLVLVNSTGTDTNFAFTVQALPINAPGTPASLAGPFAFTDLSVFMARPTASDFADSAVFVSWYNSGAYTSEALRPDGTVLQPSLAGSNFGSCVAYDSPGSPSVGALPLLRDTVNVTSIVGGNVLQLRGIQGTVCSAPGSTVNAFDIRSGAVTAFQTSSGGSYTLAANEPSVFVQASSNSGVGAPSTVISPSSSGGAAVDLSTSLVVPISLPKTFIEGTYCTPICWGAPIPRAE